MERFGHPPRGGEGGGGTTYNSLYGEAPCERGTFSGFRYMIMKGWGFHFLKSMKG